jgi:hypothetical protein
MTSPTADVTQRLERENRRLKQVGTLMMEVALVVLALVGCAAQDTRTWHRANVTPAEFQRDRYECYVQAQSLPVQPGYNQYCRQCPQGVDMAPRGQVFEMCMNARGYSLY